MDLNLIVNLTAAGILILSVLWAILFKKHAIMRLVCVTLRAILAFVGTAIFKSQLTKSGEDVQALITQGLGSENSISELIASSPALADIALSLTASLLSVIIFLILYFALGIVMLLVRMIACIILRKRKKSVGVIGRAVCGLIQGFIILTCILVPVSTYADVAASAVPTVSQISDRDMSSGEKSVSEFNSCFVFKAHRLLGGNALSKALTSMDIKIGEKTVSTSLTKEADAIFTMVSDAAPLIKTPLASYTEKELTALNGLGSSVTKSKLLCAIAAEVLSGASEAWDNGQTYMGIEKPALDPTFDPLIYKTISILGQDSSDSKQLKEDIDTFAQVLTKVITAANQSEQTEGEGTDLTNAILAEGMVKDVLDTLNANPRMRPLIPVITNIGLSIIADSLGIDANAAESYKKLTTAIAVELNASAALVADERQEKMEQAISTAITNLNITDIDQTEISIISMSVISYFDGVTNKSATEATADDVAVFLDEMTAAINTQDGEQTPVNANGDYGMSKLDAASQSTAAQAGQLITNICSIQSSSVLSTAEKEAQIAALLNSSSVFTQNSVGLSASKLADIKISLISSAERDSASSANALTAVGGLVPEGDNTVFIYTLDGILISENAINSDISEQAMAQIIDSISLMFTSISDIMSSLGEDDSAALSAICSSFDAILDAFAGNEQFYGSEKTDRLLATLLFSDTVKSMTNMSPLDTKNVLAARVEKNVSFTALLCTVSETVNTLDSIKNGTGITTENIGALVDSLIAEGAGSVIATMITPEKMNEIGFGDQEPEKLESASALIQSIFINISELNSEEPRENEVEAVRKTVALFADANSTANENPNAFGEYGRLGYTAESLVDSILGSTAVSKALADNEIADNPFGIELSEGDRSAVSTTINERLVNADADTARTLNSLAVLLGVTL